MHLTSGLMSTTHLFSSSISVELPHMLTNGWIMLFESPLDGDHQFRFIMWWHNICTYSLVCISTGNANMSTKYTLSNRRSHLISGLAIFSRKLLWGSVYAHVVLRSLAALLVLSVVAHPSASALVIKQTVHCGVDLTDLKLNASPHYTLDTILP